MARRQGDAVFCTLWKWTMPLGGMCTTTLEQVEPFAERLERFVQILRAGGE